jgi:hypothetical protein
MMLPREYGDTPPPAPFGRDAARRAPDEKNPAARQGILENKPNETSIPPKTTIARFFKNTKLNLWIPFSLSLPRLQVQQLFYHTLLS